MTDPAVADRDGGRAVEWAESITEYHPHGLADIENVVLFNDTLNSRQLRHGASLRFWANCWSELSIALWAAPVAAPVVFTSGRWWGTTREYSAWWAYPAAAVVSWIGILVLGIFYLRWRRHRGFRNSVATAITVVYVVSTALALLASYRLAGTYDGSIGWYVTPMWILLVLSVVSSVYMVRSPESRAWDSLMSSGKKRLPVDRIHADDRAWLLQERGRVIRVLDERGLLEGGETPEELAARPLGELHLPTPGAR